MDVHVQQKRTEAKNWLLNSVSPRNVASRAIHQHLVTVSNLIKTDNLGIFMDQCMHIQKFSYNSIAVSFLLQYGPLKESSG